MNDSAHATYLHKQTFHIDNSCLCTERSASTPTFTMVNRTEVNVLIDNFDQSVKHYFNKTSSVSPQLAGNVSSIRSWVDEQIASAADDKRKENIEHAGQVIQASISALSDLSSGKPDRVMKGALSIVSSVAVLVGGPHGALAGAMCGILGSVLSAGSPSQPDLAAQLVGVVREELRNFNMELKSERLAGLLGRMAKMNIALKNMKEQTVVESKPWWWMGGQYKNPSKDSDIPDKGLFLTDLPQFIYEVASKFDQGLRSCDQGMQPSSEGAINACIASIVAYCNAQAALIILLTNVWRRWRRQAIRPSVSENHWMNTRATPVKNLVWSLTEGYQYQASKQRRG